MNKNIKQKKCKNKIKIHKNKKSKNKKNAMQSASVTILKKSQ